MSNQISMSESVITNIPADTKVAVDEVEEKRNMTNKKTEIVIDSTTENTKVTEDGIGKDNKMNTLKHKIDFAVIVKVDGGNPNGDPENNDHPRMDQDGYGIISDVCIRRKIRNRIQDEGGRIFYQSANRIDDGAESLSERYRLLVESLPAERQNVQAIKEEICKEWFDVRAFGQTFAFKSKNGIQGEGTSIGVRGPVSLRRAKSTAPIDVEIEEIRRSFSYNLSDAQPMGLHINGEARYNVNDATYIIYGSIIPKLADKTGFSDSDAEMLKSALATMYDNDISAKRPAASMIVDKVYWFEHDSLTGQYCSRTVFDSIKVSEDGDVTVDPLEGLVPKVIEG